MIKLRNATKEDVPFILSITRELAEFEKALDQVTITQEELIRDGFGEKPLFQVLIIENNNDAIGHAFFYNRYSTWRGKTLYLEDLYIRPEFRGGGIGKMVMQHLAQIAVDTNCARFEWQVLDWNTGAIKLYEKLGANIDPEWLNCRLEGAKLQHLTD